MPAEPPTFGHVEHVLTFYPSYQDLGHRNWDLGNRASLVNQVIWGGPMPGNLKNSVDLSCSDLYCPWCQKFLPSSHSRKYLFKPLQLAIKVAGSCCSPKGTQPTVVGGLTEYAILVQTMQLIAFLLIISYQLCVAHLFVHCEHWKFLSVLKIGILLHLTTIVLYFKTIPLWKNLKNRKRVSRVIVAGSVSMGICLPFTSRHWWPLSKPCQFEDAAEKRWIFLE